MSNRWNAFITQPEFNWSYKSTPQPNVGGRSVDASRGKALGGTSNINFCCWTHPNRDGLNEWAARVGDPFFNWENSKPLIDGFVKYNMTSLNGTPSHPVKGMTDRRASEFANDVSDRTGGPFNVEFSAYLKKGDAAILDGAVEHGFLMNADMTSGNPLGFGILPSMSTGGALRTTPTHAFLSDPPSNLTIKTGLEATRVIFEGNTAKAAEVNGGEQIFVANRCVVLSAGAINTPKLLLLSGVGPVQHLADRGISLTAEMPGVGQYLKDHLVVFLSWQVDEELAGQPIPGSVVPHPNQDFMNFVVGFDRDETMMKHVGFSGIPYEEQRFLQRKETPTLELFGVTNWTPGAPTTSPNLTIGAVHLATQSTGSIELASSKWQDAPAIDYQLLNDDAGLDLASAVSYVRRMRAFVENTKSLSEHIVAPIVRPKSDSDEDIIAYVRDTIGTLWHPCCTARMGSLQDEGGNSVVDPSFRVHGLENLRIADLSVAPVLPNSHPVSTALLVGAWAAERMISELQL